MPPSYYGDPGRIWRHLRALCPCRHPAGQPSGGIGGLEVADHASRLVMQRWPFQRLLPPCHRPPVLVGVCLGQGAELEPRPQGGRPSLDGRSLRRPQPWPGGDSREPGGVRPRGRSRLAGPAGGLGGTATWHSRRPLRPVPSDPRRSPAGAAAACGGRAATCQDDGAASTGGWARRSSAARAAGFGLAEAGRSSSPVRPAIPSSSESRARAVCSPRRQPALPWEVPSSPLSATNWGATHSLPSGA